MSRMSAAQQPSILNPIEAPFLPTDDTSVFVAKISNFNIF